MCSATRELIGTNQRIRWLLVVIQREIRVNSQPQGHRKLFAFEPSCTISLAHLWASIRCWRDNWTFARWSVLTEIAVAVWSVAHRLMDLDIWSLDGDGMLGRLWHPQEVDLCYRKRVTPDGVLWEGTFCSHFLFSLLPECEYFVTWEPAVSMALPSLQWPNWFS